MLLLRKYLLVLAVPFGACAHALKAAEMPAPPATLAGPALAPAPAWQPAWNAAVERAIAKHSPALLTPGPKPRRAIQAVCPGFVAATPAQRSRFWSAFFEAIARYESNFDPAARMQEAWSDPDTGAPQMSEGLLQLSYSDRAGHPDCTLDRAAGNIVDPEVNLSCGVAILRRQLEVRGALFPPGKPYYWSVLTSRKVRPKVEAYLSSSVEALPFCRRAEKG